MSMSRVGTGAKDLADALRGSSALLAVLAMFVGILAVPVYFLAGLLAGLGWADWLNALCCVGLAAAELYVLVLIPEHLDRRDDRRERREFETARLRRRRGISRQKSATSRLRRSGCPPD